MTRMSLPCVRIYTDEDGASHFDDVEIPLRAVDFAPPAPLLDVSDRSEASCGFLRAPSGWFGDWHPAPRRQLMCLLSGMLEVEVSDGEARELDQGTVVLLEDTSGVGHTTKVVSDDPAVMMFAQLR